MESEANTKTSESGDLFSERRQRMLARLEARRAQQMPIVKAAASTAAAADFDKLLAKATDLINSSKTSIESDFLQELEAALTLMLPGHQSRRLNEALKTLRSRMQEQMGLAHQKAGFSFSAKSVATELQKPKELITVCSPLGDSESTTKSRLRKSVVVTGKLDEEMVVGGEDGEEVVISDIMRCVVRIPFKASAVHIRSVNRSTMIFAPVKTSVLIRDCRDLTIAVSAQQIRIHDSHQMRLYVEVRSALIIEDCDGVEVARYNVKGVDRDPENDNWHNVQDFNWLSAEEHSPNWKIMTENSTEAFDL